MTYRLSLFLVLFVLGGIDAALSQTSIATCSPVNPRVGDRIVLTYNPSAKGATIREPESMAAEVMVLRESGMPELVEVPLAKEKNGWVGSFALSGESAQLFLYRFVAGKLKDDNNGKLWDSFVYTAKGKPVRGAHLMRSQVMRGYSFGDFSREKDGEGAKKELAAERKLYPESYQAASAQWSAALRDDSSEKTKKKIRADLDKMVANAKNDETAYAALIGWYARLDDSEKTEKLQAEAIAKNPKGKVAESKAQNEIWQKRDPAARAAAIGQFLKDFPQEGEQLENLHYMLALAYAQTKEYDKAEQVIPSLPANAAGMLYNQMAWGLIDKGEDLERATRWAQLGVESARKSVAGPRPSYMKESEWEEMTQSQLGMVLDTYAFGLVKQGKAAEAKVQYEEAYAVTQGKTVEINARYVDCLVKAGDAAKARTVARECVRKGVSGDDLVASYKEAYMKTEGSDQGFEKELAEARAVAKEEMRKELLKERVNKPAVDFTLKALDGSTVTLSKLKGKVVVVDFWATWCGPCRSSFPYLQKVYEAYKDNPKVAILALNTWENEKGEKREALVKKFMEESKYTFPVLYDTDFVEKYGVSGIPTKFIIDRNGMIQFKSIGFDSGDKMINEMMMEIDLLLNEDLSSAK